MEKTTDEIVGLSEKAGWAVLRYILLAVVAASPFGPLLGNWLWPDSQEVTNAVCVLIALAAIFCAVRDHRIELSRMRKALATMEANIKIYFEANKGKDRATP